jgi:hypothetical protein
MMSYWRRNVAFNMKLVTQQELPNYTHVLQYGATVAYYTLAPNSQWQIHIPDSERTKETSKQHYVETCLSNLETSSLDKGLADLSAVFDLLLLLFPDFEAVLGL